MDTVESIEQVQPPISWAKDVSSKMKHPEVSGTENQEKAKKTEITFKQKKIELLETSEYSDKYKFITVPSYTGLSIWDVSQKAYNTLKDTSEVIDITALKHINFNSYPSMSLKIILKTKNDNEIPNSLNIDDTKVWTTGNINAQRLN
ncbi:hypothetical protein AYI70_g8838 [Smittium culicis]|uniref:Uncharacterized protein n=1 Tax=Smittium culicis TaxID=133412 RepID=A0A1R1XE45_9FUNG|nr:hypothetical protein AYI70_g8838 [Smittium culicis]